MVFMISIYMLLVSMLFLLVSIYMMFFGVGLMLEWLIMSVNSINIEFLVMLDWVSVLFMGIVLLISSMIFLYSSIYMEGSKFLLRYYYLVMLFVFSMELMIMSPNLISIMFGWDGLGLVSFCLIVYYQNYSSYNSGMLTVLLNRFGDILILISIGIMFMYGSWSMMIMENNKLLVLLILIAGMTKSAQMPFSSWLPLAMAAPTPVSALVHSSTLVTAGVYLLIRFSKFLLEDELKMILLNLSILTMFMSGLMANFEFDLKKIIALSTLSQLGLMMMILMMGLPILSFYHLLTHAIFKSLLFMSVGIIIHLMSNNQDIRLMGNMSESIPYTMMSFQLTLVALCGFPFFSGFYSKDLIMEFMNFMKVNYFLYILSLVSLSFTVMYSIRLMIYVFFKEFKFNSLSLNCENKLMSFSMVILVLMSIWIGSILNWMFFYSEMVFLTMTKKMLTLFMVAMGVMYMTMGLINKIKNYYLLYFFSSMWFLNYSWSEFVYLGLKVGNKLYSQDKEWMEFYSGSMFMQLMYEFKNNSMNFNYKIYMFMYLFIISLLIVYVF